MPETRLREMGVVVRTVRIEDLSVRLGRRRVLERIRLTVPAGRTTVLLGPSGSGKTTLLKAVAGLLRPAEGRVYIGGEDVSGRPAGKRGIGMVFQDFALYPDMDARANVLAYFLFRGRRPELDAEARARFQRTAELMGVELTQLLGRTPRTLSPGEKQRVALARCVTREPALFLLDEPFAHLDEASRVRTRDNLRRLLREFGVTTLYVTHDQREALLFGDTVALLRDGRLVQVGPFAQLYRDPRDVFVAGFLSADPLAPAINLLDGGRVGAAFAGATLGVRPEGVRVRATPGDAPGFYARIEARTPLPSRGADLLAARPEGAAAELIHAYWPHEDADAIPLGAPGDRVWLELRAPLLFDPASGVRLPDPA